MERLCSSVGSTDTAKKSIKAIGHDPLFGHRSGKNMNTHWLCFMKNCQVGRGEGIG